MGWRKGNAFLMRSLMETARIKTSKGNVCWHDMLFNRHRRRHRGFKQMPPQPEAVKHVACYSLHAALFFLMKMVFSVFFPKGGYF